MKYLTLGIQEHLQTQPSPRFLKNSLVVMPMHPFPSLSGAVLGSSTTQQGRSRAGTLPTVLSHKMDAPLLGTWKVFFWVAAGKRCISNQIIIVGLFFFPCCSSASLQCVETEGWWEEGHKHWSGRLILARLIVELILRSYSVFPS